MSAPTGRWEHGSDTPLVAPDELLPADQETATPWPADAPLLGTGRDAIALLLTFGRSGRGWRRVWLPSYYCQNVVRSVAATRLEVALYPARPKLPPHGTAMPAAAPGDVVITFGHFGLYRTPQLPPGIRERVCVVEDHSHDPWSPSATGSSADYCFASLRKTLPLPDGGVLWSPLHRPLPGRPPRTADRDAATLDRMQAMALKAAYLAGRGGSKQTYRELFAAAEGRDRAGRPSAASPYTEEMLRRLPVARWRQRRQHNHDSFLTALSPDARAVALESDGTGSVPCLCALVLQSRAERDEIRTWLADRQVYAAAHWPMDRPAHAGVSAADRDLAGRVITVQCDARYDAEDMRSAARLVSEAMERFRR